MQTDSSLDIASGRYLNASAIREHALACSAKFRAGKFTRVGQDFEDEVAADVESIVRELRGKCPTFHAALTGDSMSAFVTGALIDKVSLVLNEAIGRIIQNKVQRQPTVGCTLRATR